MPDTGEHRPRRRSGTPEQRDADVERNEKCEDDSSRPRFDRAFEEWQQPRRIDDFASDAADDYEGGQPPRTDA